LPQLLQIHFLLPMTVTHAVDSRYNFGR
jgi:hypothetical protein